MCVLWMVLSVVSLRVWMCYCHFCLFLCRSFVIIFSDVLKRKFLNDNTGKSEPKRKIKKKNGEHARKVLKPMKMMMKKWIVFTYTMPSHRYKSPLIVACFYFCFSVISPAFHFLLIFFLLSCHLFQHFFTCLILSIEHFVSPRFLFSVNITSPFFHVEKSAFLHLLFFTQCVCVCFTSISCTFGLCRVWYGVCFALTKIWSITVTAYTVQNTFFVIFFFFLATAASIEIVIVYVCVRWLSVLWKVMQLDITLRLVEFRSKFNKESWIFPIQRSLLLFVDLFFMFFVVNIIIIIVHFFLFLLLHSIFLFCLCFNWIQGSNWCCCFCCHYVLLLLFHTFIFFLVLRSFLFPFPPFWKSNHYIKKQLIYIL